jgi:hypothetical protein
MQIAGWAKSQPGRRAILSLAAATGSHRTTGTHGRRLPLPRHPPPGRRGTVFDRIADIILMIVVIALIIGVCIFLWAASQVDVDIVGPLG